MGGGTTIRPTTTNQIIPAYTDKELTVEGSANLIANNIRKGIDIFGIIGTLAEGVNGIDFGTVTRSSSASSVYVTINHNLGVVPKRAYLISINPFETGVTTMGLNDYSCSISSAGSYGKAINTKINALTKTETTIRWARCDSGFQANWAAGTYYWFAIA